MCILNDCYGIIKKPQFSDVVWRVLRHETLNCFIDMIAYGSHDDENVEVDLHYGYVFCDAENYDRRIDSENCLTIYAPFEKICNELVMYRDYADKIFSNYPLSKPFLMSSDEAFDLWLGVLRKLWGGICGESCSFSLAERYVIFQVLKYEDPLLSLNCNDEIANVVVARTASELFDCIDTLLGLDLLVGLDFNELSEKIYTYLYDVLVEDICSGTIETLDEDAALKMQDLVFYLHSKCPTYEDFDKFALQYDNHECNLEKYSDEEIELLGKIIKTCFMLLKQLVCQVFDMRINSRFCISDVAPDEYLYADCDFFDTDYIDLMLNFYIDSFDLEYTPVFMKDK